MGLQKVLSLWDMGSAIFTFSWKTEQITCRKYHSFQSKVFSLLVLCLVDTVLKSYGLGSTVWGKCGTWDHVKSSSAKCKGLYIGEEW